MGDIEGTIYVDVLKTIAPGQTVRDKDGSRVGEILEVNPETGYLTVETGPLLDVERPFSEKLLYIPFSLITSIDPRELYLSRSKDELHRDHADPPAHTIAVGYPAGAETAATIEASGYDGRPVVVERARIDELKRRIAVGDHVYTSERIDLGRIKEYDLGTGWMLIEKGVMSRHDLMLPVTIIDDVNPGGHEVHLALSRAGIERMRDVQPGHAVSVEADTKEGA